MAFGRRVVAVLSAAALLGALAVARSPPPLGARCAGHANPPPLGQATQVFVNSTPIPLTWNITATCPRMPPTEWVCCEEVQFEFMTIQLRIMDINFQDCEACNVAVRDMWCHYTCSPFQGDFDHPLIVNDTTQQILSTELVVTEDLAGRIWKSCKNSIFANQFLVKVMFPTVAGLFQSMADFSPQVISTGAAPGHLVRRVYIQNPKDPLVAPGIVPLNFSTVENDYTCSDGKLPPLPRSFPLPKATVGPLSAQAAVGILLGCLIVCLSAVGALNGKHDRAWAQAEEEDSKEDVTGAGEEQKPLVSGTQKPKLNGHATNGHTTNGHATNGHRPHRNGGLVSESGGEDAQNGH